MSTKAKHTADRLQAALVKVKRLIRLEAALVNFFAEVMDRAGAEWGTPNKGGITEHEASYRRNIWKENLLKMAEGDPLSLLKSLRTHLRVQFAPQDQHQRQTAQSISALASRNEL